MEGGGGGGGTSSSTDPRGVRPEDAAAADDGALARLLSGIVLSAGPAFVTPGALAPTIDTAGVRCCVGMLLKLEAGVRKHSSTSTPPLLLSSGSSSESTGRVVLPLWSVEGGS